MVMTFQDFNEWSPQGPVTELSVEHCWNLLKATNIGRLGLSVDNQPEIFPVNYIADGSSVVFRTARGTKLRELLINDSVVFEVDEQLENGAWSVTLKGTADVLGPEIPDPVYDDETLPQWAPTAEYLYVRITPRDIRGRQFEHQLRLIVPES
ncbi:pyridoxamine 5'-phosphate oxidase family protein [Subtercola boreus]|nr:pyridoxamine 5'-phosphate oxidase family protein [Subtercola boreus]